MRTYTLSSPQFITLRDREYVAPQSPYRMFSDAYTLFNIRIQRLGTLQHVTTLEESDVLRIMLETLITTKYHLQQR